MPLLSGSVFVLRGLRVVLEGLKVVPGGLKVLRDRWRATHMVSSLVPGTHSQ